jgi:exopolysaccharide biosynthesis polyprenyl glycosylphosphotransferase
VALFIFILKFYVFSRAVFLESVVFLFFFLGFWRFAKRLFVRSLITRGHFNYNVLVVGADKETELLFQEITDNPFLGVKVVGVLDDKKTGIFSGYKILGGTDKLEYAVKRLFVDDIFISKHSFGIHTRELIDRCIKLDKTVRLLEDDFGLSSKKLELNYLGPFPLISYLSKDSLGFYGGIKRIIDVIVSGLLLILLSPVFIIIAIMIKVISGGTVFYVSKRSGKKGKMFNCYKFCSMVDNADSLKPALKHKSEVDGPIFKIKDDPRITSIGKFLRKYSLDELPQLFNVFKGDMSLVGPRPFPVEESDKIEYRHIPRLNIRPGITGLAQIKGRSDLKFNNWMRWDIWYANNLSFGLDMKILLWTIPAVIKARGAY